MNRIVSLLVLLILIFTAVSAIAQINFSDQGGGFGPYVGLVKSNLGQHLSGGEKQGVSDMHQGFELGFKSELYRTRWMRGNLMAGYMQYGSKEYYSVENTVNPVEVELSAVKVALNPILFKVGGDNIHGYFGGGAYGSYLIKQSISQPDLSEQYWSGERKIKGADAGLDFVAGIHLYHFDIEAHAQYGLLDLGTRWDGSAVKQQFYGIHIAYLYVNQHVTRKSCRDHRDKIGRGFN